MQLLVGQRRQIEKTGDAVDVEKIHFAWPTREADREDGKTGKHLVALPRAEWEHGEEIVFADDDVWPVLPRPRGAVGETDGGIRRCTNAREESRDVLADVGVSCNTENEHFGAPGRGEMLLSQCRAKAQRGNATQVTKLYPH